MISLRAALVGFFSGVLFTLAWILFIDGQTQSYDPFVGTYIIPPLLATMGAIFLNFVSVQGLAKNKQVKVWVFFWMTILFISIGGAIYILTVDYPPDDNYAGVTILLQTIVMTMAGILFFVGRQPC